MVFQADTRIARYSIVQRLSTYHWPYVRHYATSDTAHSHGLQELLVDMQRYSIYLYHVLLDEHFWQHDDNVLPELTTLTTTLARSLHCALQIYADRQNVEIPRLPEIEYTNPDTKMWSNYEAFIVLNSFQSNYLSYALEFFQN